VAASQLASSPIGGTVHCADSDRCWPGAIVSSAVATPGSTAAIIPSTAASTQPTRFERDHIDDFMLTASLPERVTKIAACGRKLVTTTAVPFLGRCPAVGEIGWIYGRARYG
jgi:hypothetical protein